MTLYLLNCDSSFGLSSIMPILAFILSIIALFSARTFSRKNIRLSIQQAIFKTVSEKAKDCNTLWENEPENEKQNEDSPHFKIMSELIITTEIIEKSFSLFGQNDSSIDSNKNDYYYLFWKQLRTDLRGWIRRTPQIAQQQNNLYYSQQVADLHSKFEKYFERVL